MTATLSLAPSQPSDALREMGSARILAHPVATGLRAHEANYGSVVTAMRGLIDEVDVAGLRGRGGAGFPTSVKMRSVASAAGRGLRGRTPTVVANGTEGEPASAKDRVLVQTAPHLVIDGMAAAATAVGATKAVLCLDRTSRPAVNAARIALDERRGRDPVELEIAEVPSRYVAGEETALISWLNGGPAKPTLAPPRPSERGVGGSPTLVDNVETLANVALIARFGAAAWTSVGEEDENGTMLVTVRGAARSGVYEIEIGTAVASVLSAASAGPTSGVLVGGYFGTWLTPKEASRAVMSRRGLQPYGASPGCGLVAAMPEGHCPLQEVSKVLRWLAANSAGQCGACVNGLPALAGAFAEMVNGDEEASARAQLDRWTPMLLGRGACKLPDGAVRFLSSARRVFASHVDDHRRRGSCPPNATQLLPTPALGGWR